MRLSVLTITLMLGDAGRTGSFKGFPPAPVPGVGRQGGLDHTMVAATRPRVERQRYRR